MTTLGVLNVIVAAMAMFLLVASWAYVLWRQFRFMRKYNDRRARLEFMVSLIITASALAFAVQQAISIILDTDEGGLRLQLFLIGMGIGALTWAGVVRALTLWHR